MAAVVGNASEAGVAAADVAVVVVSVVVASLLHAVWWLKHKIIMDKSRQKPTESVSAVRQTTAGLG